MSATSSRPVESLLAHRLWVRELARRLVADASAADDLEQQAWLAALRRPPREADSPRAWLTTVLRRWLYKNRRGDERRARRERAAARREAVPSTAAIVAEADAHRRVVAAVFALEEPLRTTVLLRFFEDLPPAEVAGRTGVPLETARSRIKRALALLRTALDDAAGGDRRAWHLWLQPLASAEVAGAGAGAGAASLAGTLLEVLLVSTKAKVAAAAAVLLSGASVYLAVTQAGTAPAVDPAAQPPGQIVAAADAATSGAPAATEEPAAAGSARTELAGASVEVRVEVRTWSGAPIDGALVEAFTPPAAEWLNEHEHDRPEPAPSAQRSTDADGTATFALAAGRWHLIASKQGHCRAGAPDVVLRAGVPADPVVIHLGTGHALAGHVFAAGGRPVAGATVTAFPTSSALVRPRTTTDSQGRYRLDGLRAGPTHVAAALPGGSVSPLETIQVPEVAELDLVLRSGGVLQGRVTEQGTGRGLAGARVQVQTAGHGSYRPMTADTWTDAQGRYRIDTLLESFIHDVTVSKDGYVQVRDVTDDNFDATIPFLDGGTWTRDLVLGRGGVLAVTVRGPLGPVAGCTLTAQWVRHSFAAEQPTATTDANGRATFAAVVPGRVLVQARAEGLQQAGMPVDWWALLRDPTADNRCVAEVPDGGEAALELELMRPPAICGRVLGPGDQGLQGVLVNFARAEDASAAAVTDAAGAFRLAGVRPATRCALSVAKAGYVASGPLAVDVPATGDLTGVACRMTTAARVRGNVRSRTAPLVDAFVQVSIVPAQEQGWQQEFRWANTPRAPVAADGSYDVALPVAAGAFAVRAAALRRPEVTSAPVAIEPGRVDYRVDLVVESGSTLTGQVVALGSGDSVPRPRIRATWLAPGSDPRQLVRGPDGPPVAAVGDGAGRFAVEHLLPGRYELQVAADGFLVESTEVRVPQEGELVVSMPAELSIEGVVEYADGRPVEGGQVGPEPQAGNRDMSTRIEQMSFVGPDGRFKIPRLQAGLYRIRVAPPRTGRANFRSEQSGIVAAGARDLRIVVEAGAVIAGRVIDGEGRGLSDLGVSARRPGSDQHGSYVETLRDGTFTLIGLEDGADYTLTVNGSNHGGRNPYASVQRPDVMAGTTGLEFVLQVGLAIAGTVVDADGRPVAGADVAAVPVGAEDSYGAVAWTDQDGRFEIRGLQPGRHRLAAPPWRGGGLLLTGGDDVAAGTTGLVLTASAGAKITGTAVDENGAPLPGVEVEAESAQRGVRGGAWIWTRPDGTFELAGLVPDAVYDVSARLRGRVPATQRAVPAGRTGLRLELALGLQVQGRLVDAGGRPLAAINVRFLHEGGARASARTDADGRFTVTGLVPGTWSAEAAMGTTERLVMQPCGTVQAGQRDVQLQLRD